jgi:hypothetical protein
MKDHPSNKWWEKLYKDFKLLLACIVVKKLSLLHWEFIMTTLVKFLMV